MASNLSQLKDLAALLESVVKTIGLVVGAVWVYLKFIRTREKYPKIEFTVNVRLLGRQDNLLLLEVIADLENKGLVRHWLTKFTLNVLTLKATEAVTHGDERINYQLLFSKPNLAATSQEIKQNKINLIPVTWESSFIDAGTKQQYTYLTAVPEATTFISIYGRFHYRDKESEFQTAQKTFSVVQLGIS